MCPLQKLKFLGVAFMYTGDCVCAINVSDQFVQASNASDQSIKENSRRTTLVLGCITESYGFRFGCRR